ncbi:MAG TPA: L-histidine N(alpha)-methyltransferase [Frateuria sp.]|uniref:L-histidine N(alpha)-methyltransferase n=1 Tax=Frateuria sp. TaxID=2211372 RepID=UPI002D80DBFF|nr:L-histidine N(alpha)-methyltransferase [Frateuria sp.]HET6805555.1 L-histidine N(alpha)-methyltransferase [Frateuria sp.]
MDIRALDIHDGPTPPASGLLEIARRGLRAKPKRLPSWLFYDAQGSALFERICEQPEYYLTRCETALMQAHAAGIADTLGVGVRLVEYGSGSAVKTRLLLENMAAPVSYVPVEISPEPLQQSVQRLNGQFPHLPVQPLCADFTRSLRLPIPPRAPRRTVLYFPGSTIGNFDAREATALLRKMRTEMGDNGGILIGVDLKKETSLIEAAYNDAAGVTAEFTLNMLVRLNRELGCDFDLAAFRHRAHYNALAGRIETSLVSQCAQKVRVGRSQVAFDEGEAIRVEISTKYSLEEFAALAAKAGLEVLRVWLDPERMFSVQYLVRAGSVAR